MRPQCPRLHSVFLIGPEAEIDRHRESDGASRLHAVGARVQCDPRAVVADRHFPPRSPYSRTLEREGKSLESEFLYGHLKEKGAVNYHLTL
jgi:hypothetical protein